LVLAIVTIIVTLSLFSLNMKGINESPYAAFILITSITIILIGTIYWVIFVGFIEASELFR